MSAEDVVEGMHQGANRYCSTCGAPTAAADGVLLEHTTAEAPDRTDESLQSPARLRWVLVAIAALGVVVFGLSQWQQGPSSHTAEGENDARNDGRTPAAAVNTSEPAAEVAAPTEPATTVATSQPATEVGPGGGPVLGERTGLGFIAARIGFEALWVVDLDTGLEYELSAGGDLIGMLDGHLLVNDAGKVQVVALDSQDDVGTNLVPIPGAWAEVVRLTEDEVWVVKPTTSSDSEETGEFLLEAYDVSGNKVDEDVVDGRIFYPGGVIDSELVGEIGGGVYRRNGGEYQLLSTGSLIAAGTELALVRECDERRRCRQNWYNKSDWNGPLDLPDPEVAAQSWVALRGQDRWLVEIDWRLPRGRFVDVSTGRLVRERGLSSSTMGSVREFPVSSDGRWLIEDAPTGVLIVDLESGTEFLYESENIGPGNVTGVFVDLEDIGFIP